LISHPGHDWVRQLYARRISDGIEVSRARDQVLWVLVQSWFFVNLSISSSPRPSPSGFRTIDNKAPLQLRYSGADCILFESLGLITCALSIRVNNIGRAIALYTGQVARYTSMIASVPEHRCMSLGRMEILTTFRETVVLAAHCSEDSSAHSPGHLI
jgi:hypothetical protein